MKNVMTRAWEIAKEAEKASGYKAVEFFAEALRMAWKEAKEMTDEEKIAVLESKGFKRWTKYGKDRMYIDAKTLLNLDIHYRKSGTISFSEMDGETISHGEAYRLLGSKIWIDLADFSKHVNADEWEADEIITPALDKLTAGIC